MDFASTKPAQNPAHGLLDGWAATRKTIIDKITSFQKPVSKGAASSGPGTITLQTQHRCAQDQCRKELPSTFIVPAKTCHDLRQIVNRLMWAAYWGRILSLPPPRQERCGLRGRINGPKKIAHPGMFRPLLAALNAAFCLRQLLAVWWY